MTGYSFFDAPVIHQTLKKENEFPEDFDKLYEQCLSGYIPEFEANT